MFKLRKISPMVRSIGTMGAVAAIVGGVTFAQLQSSPVTLTSNTITTSANLKISSDGGHTWGASATGFTFNGMVPGGQPSDSHTFYIKNVGPTPVELSMSIPIKPTFTTNPSGEGNSSVHDYYTYLNLSCVSGSNTFGLPSGQASSLAELFDDNGTLLVGQGKNQQNLIKPGDTATCTADVNMASNAIQGTVQSVTASRVDLNFVGIAS
jgi:hypothetical protein